MRRNEQQRIARRQRIAQIVVGIFLVVLMVFSILGYGLSNAQSSDPLVFNGKKFTQTNDGFTVKAADRTLLVQDLPIEGDATNATYQNIYGSYVSVTADPAAFRTLRQAGAFIFTFDPATEQPGIQFLELARLDLARQSGLNAYAGLLVNSSQYPTIPVIDCAQATPQLPVLKFLVGNATSQVTFTQEGGCITVAGDAWGVLAAKDHLLLVLAGVMPDG